MNVKSLVIMRRNRLCSGSSIRGNITGALLSAFVAASGRPGWYRADRRGSTKRRPDVLVAAHHPGRLALVHCPLQPGPSAPPSELGRGLQRAARGTRDGNDRKISTVAKAEVVDIAALPKMREETVIDSRLPIRPERKVRRNGSQLSVATLWDDDGCRPAITRGRGAQHRTHTARRAGGLRRGWARCATWGRRSPGGCG